MNKKSLAALLTVASMIALVGCATTPVPFQLIDAQHTYSGSFNPQNMSMDILIADKPFHGFYIVAADSTVSFSESASARRFRSWQTVSNSTSNSARAQLTSADGELITCAFLFQDKRAVGDCKSSKGKDYQFIANE